MTNVTLATSDQDIEDCFVVMVELHPRLKEKDGSKSFLTRIQHQIKSGYKLAMLRENGSVVGCVGYRFVDMLAFDRFCYIDDLVTKEDRRSGGHGQRLFDFVKEKAEEAGCSYIRLDSGVHRKQAHKFYFRQRMTIDDFHFALPLKQKSSKE